MATQITKHFTREELQCKCGCGKMETPTPFILRLEHLRVTVGFPLPISSGYRCPDHNDKVSSTGRDGPHTRAAVDIAVQGQEAYLLLAAAIRQGFVGVGVQQKGSGRFIHLDDRTSPAIWSY